MAHLKCPNCSREFVRRVSRVGLLERSMGWIFISPFKCQICGHRFRSMQFGVRDARFAEDHRDYDRMHMNFPVHYARDGVPGMGLVIDISMGGCSFNTAGELKLGTLLNLELVAADDAAPILVDAAVVRHVQGQTVGVEFLQWQHKERERLQLFVRGLLIGRRT
jgi:hypothetical protein